jgi:hypothetical protein
MHAVAHAQELLLAARHAPLRGAAARARPAPPRPVMCAPARLSPSAAPGRGGQWNGGARLASLRARPRSKAGARARAVGRPGAPKNGLARALQGQQQHAQHAMPGSQQLGASAAQGHRECAETGGRSRTMQPRWQACFSRQLPPSRRAGPPLGTYSALVCVTNGTGGQRRPRSPAAGPRPGPRGQGPASTGNSGPLAANFSCALARTGPAPPPAGASIAPPAGGRQAVSRAADTDSIRGRAHSLARPPGSPSPTSCA